MEAAAVPTVAAKAAARLAVREARAAETAVEELGAETAAGKGVE